MSGSNEVANLLAKRYIARPDVKAVQHNDGKWSPHTKSGRFDGERIAWSRSDLNAHLDGSRTYGHYMLNTDDTCKLFAFDVDLNKTGFLPLDPFASMPEENYEDWKNSFGPCDPREAWRQRGHVGRSWMKIQFRMIAHQLVKAITTELAIPAAAAYSGAKGIHVYGFTGTVPAEDAREAANLVLDSIGEYDLIRGQHLYGHKNADPVDGYPNLSIEVFPKQSSLDGKDLGNLMRLPLGRNLKAPDPTFFMDMTSPMSEMIPIDPVFALTTSSPWMKPNE